MLKVHISILNKGIGKGNVMRADKKIMRYIAGLLCMVLLVTTIFPQVTVNASAEQGVGDTEKVENEDTGNAEEEQQEKEPSANPEQTAGELISDAPAVYPLNNDAADVNDEPLVSEYMYEDDDMLVKAELTNPSAIPQGAELQIRSIVAEDETQKDRYYNISGFLTQKAKEEQFVLDGFLAYELYFLYNGQEIVPADGEVNVSITYKNEIVPDAYKNSQQDGKEVKLYQLQKDASQEETILLADMADNMTGFTQTENGGVDELGFTMNSYLPFMVTWKQEHQLDVVPEDSGDNSQGTDEETGEVPAEGQTVTYEYKDETIQATAVAEKGVLPDGVELQVKPIEKGEENPDAIGSIQEEMQQNGLVIGDVAAYDIKFVQDGEEVEPSQEVKIQISFVEGLKLEGSKDYYFYHVKDDGSVQDKDASLKINEDETITGIDFTSDEFSEYDIVKTQAVEDGIETIVNDDTGKSYTAVGSVKSNTNEGVVVDKTAKANTTPDGKKDGTYTIDLSAYATGVVTLTGATDIVLVLDQSGSMDDPIGVTTKIYTPQYRDISFQKEYYIKDGGEYKKVNAYGSYGDYYWTDNGRRRITPASYEGAENPNKNIYVFYTLEEKSQTKMEVLKDSVNAFIDMVKEDAAAQNLNHKIAIVGYASESGYGDNTEVLSVSGNNSSGYLNDRYVSAGVKYGYATNATYRNALQDVTVAEDAQILDKAVAVLATNGATRSDLGMDMAQKVFANNPIEDGERNRVVVMFTDGVPTTSSSFSNAVAGSAVETSNEIKNTQGATVYTIGVASQSEPLNPGVNPVTNMDKYMNYVSSNYPNAKATYDRRGDITGFEPGSGGDYTANYYASAGDAEALQAIFDNIAHEVGKSNTTLNEKSKIVDYISDYFSMEGLEYKIYESSYLGNGQWGPEVENTALENSNNVVINKSDGSVSVEGFDYSQNYILEKDPKTGKPSGKKLIIKLTVKAKDGFIGGNEVPTNDSAYIADQKGKIVKDFPVPAVDVPLQYDFLTQDQSIYITQQWSDVKAFLQGYEGNALPYQIEGKTYYVSGINNDYADVLYTVKQGDKVIGTYKVKAGSDTGAWIKEPSIDTTGLTSAEKFTISAEITPAYDGEEEGISTEAKEATLHIFKPEVTSTDTTIYLGETTNLAERITGVNWDCKEENAPQPQAGAPDLSYEYTGVNGAAEVKDPAKYGPEKDADIKLKVTANGKDITKHTTFANTSSTHEGAKDHNFTVYVKPAILQFTKEDTSGNPLEGAEFELYDGEELIAKAASAADGVVKFEKLAAGSYTLKETKAPKGYIRGDSIWRVEVKQGVATIYGSNDKPLDTIMNYSADGSIEKNKSVNVQSWDDRTYTIRLDASSIISKEEGGGKTPIDVVLVLDVSGSMAWDSYTLQHSLTVTEKNLQELDKDTIYQIKINSFWYNVEYKNSAWRYRYGSVSNNSYKLIDNFKNQSLDFYTTTTRIDAMKEAAINFIQQLQERSPESNVGIVAFSSSVNETWTKDLTSVTDGSLITTINSMRANGGTQPSKGLKRAGTILENASNAKHVVLLTDGEPDGESETAGKNAATELKGKEITIHTIGFALDNDTNRFLREDIASEINGTPSAYTADNATELINAFKFILDSTQVGITIEGAVIRDYIDPRFELLNVVDGKVEGGTVGTDEHGTYVEWESSILPKTDEGEPGWQKTLVVKAKDTYIGGNNVVTNGPESGITINGGQNNPFDQPTVNVKVRFDIGSAEDTMFYGDNIASFLTDEVVNGIFNPSEVKYKDSVFTDLSPEDFTMTWYNEKDQEVSLEDIRNSEEEGTYYLKVTYSSYGGASSTESKNHTGGYEVTPENATMTGTYKVHVVKGQIQLTKIIDQKYTQVQKTNSEQSFIFRVDRRAEEDLASDILDTYYVVIRFDANGNVVSGTDTISGLKKGFYTVTEQTEWSSKYNKDLVTVWDNYSDTKYAGAVSGVLPIGKLLNDGKTNENGQYDFYGTEDDTYAKYAVNHKAEVEYNNKIKEDWNWLSDVASAVNAFIK